MLDDCPFSIAADTPNTDQYSSTFLSEITIEEYQELINSDTDSFTLVSDWINNYGHSFLEFFHRQEAFHSFILACQEVPPETAFPILHAVLTHSQDSVINSIKASILKYIQTLLVSPANSLGIALLHDIVHGGLLARSLIVATQTIDVVLGTATDTNLSDILALLKDFILKDPVFSSLGYAVIGKQLPSRKSVKSFCMEFVDTPQARERLYKYINKGITKTAIPSIYHFLIKCTYSDQNTVKSAIECLTILTQYSPENSYAIARIMEFHGINIELLEMDTFNSIVRLLTRLITELDDIELGKVLNTQFTQYIFEKSTNFVNDVYPAIIPFLDAALTKGTKYTISKELMDAMMEFSKEASFREKERLVRLLITANKATKEIVFTPECLELLCNYCMDGDSGLAVEALETFLDFLRKLDENEFEFSISAEISECLDTLEEDPDKRLSEMATNIQEYIKTAF